MKHMLFNVKNVLEQGFTGSRDKFGLVGGAVAETHSTADDRLHSLLVVSRGEPPPGGACITQVNFAIPTALKTADDVDILFRK